MACYISSNENRVYAGLESAYGMVASLTAANRIPAIQFAPRQFAEVGRRRDKTGSRSYVGEPAGVRRRTEWRLQTYLSGWTEASGNPAQGVLFEAALGGAPKIFPGIGVASAAGTMITCAAAHGLAPGQAVTSGGEMRFVAAVASATAVVVNAPFSSSPAALGETVTYSLATRLKSVSVLDAWSPAGAVQRLLYGGAVNEAVIRVNDDYHQFEFIGRGRDLLDSASFSGGAGGLSEFPAEPEPGPYDYTIIPGHLGQVWLGATPARFYTLTEAEIRLENGLELRDREFGGGFGDNGAACIVAGTRRVGIEFRLFERDDQATVALYQAAKQRSPISAMVQLGQQERQLFGAYLPAVVPEVPEFDDRETRVEWKFRSSRAQGVADDELYVAFG
jgi:hypothetical protein